MRQKLFKYAVDIINERHISGWCFNRIRKTKPVVLSIYADQRKIGVFHANTHRQDLLDTLIHPTGNCGFRFNMPDNLDLTELDTLTLTTNGSKTVLQQYAKEQVPPVITEEFPNIFFMHIPKTAGSSFNIFAKTLFMQGQTHIHIEPEELMNMSSKIWSKYSFVSGHITMGEIKQALSKSPVELYSIIRDPYKQLHSHMNWVKGIGLDKNRGFFTKHHPDFQQLSLELNSIDLSSPEALKTYVKNIEGLAAQLFDNCQTRYFLDDKPIKVKKTDLNNAMDNILMFKNIGLTDEYKVFLKQFCFQLNSPIVDQAKKLNVSPLKQLFNYNDPEIRKTLAPLVETDLIIYNYIKNIFHSKLSIQ